MVVWSASLVAINRHETISVSIGDLHSVRAVNWDLVIVNTESVTMGVRVREKSSLEHSIFRRLNTWDEVAWSESRL